MSFLSSAAESNCVYRSYEHLTIRPPACCKVRQTVPVASPSRAVVGTKRLTNAPILRRALDSISSRSKLESTLGETRTLDLDLERIAA